MPPVPAHPALFLDIDGTLLPITARPADSRADASLVEELRNLQAAVGGALALLSGRPLAVITEMFTPLVVPAAGVHGLERMSSTGELRRASVDPSGLEDARGALLQLGEIEPRLVLEDKGDAFAVHYRAAPECAERLWRELQRIAIGLGAGFHVQPGLYVFELKPRQPNKGSALLSFMQEAPFHGRMPVAVGDDLTDLHAFRAAESQGGMAIAVGGRIRARWQLPDPAALREWLQRLIVNLRR